jgi:hypothetical protein
LSKGLASIRDDLVSFRDHLASVRDDLVSLERWPCKPQRVPR